MPQPRVNGTLQPIPQPQQLVWDPKSGLTRVLTWECADPNGLFGLASIYAGQKFGYTHNPGGVKSTLVATASGGGDGQPDVTTDTWQILANEIQKSLYEHPKAQALTSAVIKTIKDGIQNNSEPASISPALTGNAAILYDLLYRGSSHYALGQYVLRHTTNVGNSYAANVSDSNVEGIYTTAQLITETKNANLWAFPLPGRLEYKLNQIVPPTARTNFLWGWRKLPSSETSAANNRVDISTEYWLEQWSTFPYSTAP